MRKFTAATASAVLSAMPRISDFPIAPSREMFTARGIAHKSADSIVCRNRAEEEAALKECARESSTDTADIQFAGNSHIAVALYYNRVAVCIACDAADTLITADCSRRIALIDNRIIVCPTDDAADAVKSEPKAA